MNKRRMFFILVIAGFLVCLSGCQKGNNDTTSETEMTATVKEIPINQTTTNRTTTYSPDKRWEVNTFETSEESNKGEENPKQYIIEVVDTKQNKAYEFELASHNYNFFWNGSSDKLIIQATVTRYWLTELWLLDVDSMNLKYLSMDIDSIAKQQNVVCGSELLHNDDIKPIRWESDKEFLILYLILDEECVTHYGAVSYNIETKEGIAKTEDKTYFFEGDLPPNEDAMDLIKEI